MEDRPEQLVLEINNVCNNGSSIEKSGINSLASKLVKLSSKAENREQLSLSMLYLLVKAGDADYDQRLKGYMEWFVTDTTAGEAKKRLKSKRPDSKYFIV